MGWRQEEGEKRKIVRVGACGILHFEVSVAVKILSSIHSQLAPTSTSLCLLDLYSRSFPSTIFMQFGHHAGFPATFAPAASPASLLQLSPVAFSSRNHTPSFSTNHASLFSLYPTLDSGLTVIFLYLSNQPSQLVFDILFKETCRRLTAVHSS